MARDVEFRARNLSPMEVRRVEEARKDAERVLSTPITDKELLMLLVSDTAPSWRRK